MRKTQLDAYREAWGLEQDGATILEAAKRGVLLKGLNEGAKAKAFDSILRQLGICAEMSRKEIVQCLVTSMNLDDMRAHKVIKKEVGKRLSTNKGSAVSSPGDRDKVMGDVIGWFDRRMELAIRFCERSANVKTGSELENEKAK
jgi:hypothetical protein